MNKFLAILLFLAILSQSLSKMILFSNYIINKESITLKFCENKNKPKLKCNGKCHLNKQFNNQEKKDGNSKNLMNELNEVQICQDLPTILLVAINSSSLFSNWFYLNKESNGSFDSVFHPPTC